mgnify:CR=1 FL=1
MYDTIIIGGGPAGLTSAIYLRRANKKVLVLESNVCGGQIVNAKDVENYPGYSHISGFDLSENMRNQVLDLGAEIKYETVLKVDEDKKVYTANNIYDAKSIIIAIGSKNRKLMIDNEDKFTGRGISYCATCDGNFYKNKDVAVIGGGDTALDDILYLSDIANHVYGIVRKNSYKGESKEFEEIKAKENVTIYYNSEVTELIGNDTLEKIKINNEKEINVSGVFIAIGQEPNNMMFKNVVDLDEKGYIITVDEVKTKTKGIYVAGDAREKTLRQLTTATSDGALAATYAIKEME